MTPLASNLGAAIVETIRIALRRLDDLPAHERHRVRTVLLQHLRDMETNLGREIEPDPASAA